MPTKDNDKLNDAFEDWFSANFDDRPEYAYTKADVRLAFAAGQSSAIDASAKVAEDYMKLCEQTGCDFVDKTDEVGEKMYWRADGAADALEIVAGKIRELKK